MFTPSGSGGPSNPHWTRSRRRPTRADQTTVRLSGPAVKVRHTPAVTLHHVTDEATPEDLEQLARSVAMSGVLGDRERIDVVAALRRLAEIGQAKRRHPSAPGGRGHNEDATAPVGVRNVENY